MPGRLNSHEDYLALVNEWGQQLQPYSDEQVRTACRRLMGKLDRFPYPVDLHEEIASPTLSSSNVVGAMVVTLAVDTSQLDAALMKAEQLRALTASIHLPSMLSQVVIDASAGHQIEIEQTAVNAARAFIAGMKMFEATTPEL